MVNQRLFKQLEYIIFLQLSLRNKWLSVYINVYQLGLLSGHVLPVCATILIPMERMTCFTGYNLKNSSKPMRLMYKPLDHSTVLLRIGSSRQPILMKDLLTSNTHRTAHHAKRGVCIKTLQPSQKSWK